MQNKMLNETANTNKLRLRRDALKKVLMQRGGNAMENDRKLRRN